MPTEKFKVTQDDKVLRVSGPAELSIVIDYDDVWHPEVMREAKKLVKLLNAFWTVEK